MGNVRTALEPTQLSQHADHVDALMTAYIRTVTIVTYPAALLVKRACVDTCKSPGASAMYAVYRGHGRERAMCTGTLARLDVWLPRYDRRRASSQPI